LRVRTERAEIAGEVVIVPKRGQIALRLLLRLGARLRLGWLRIALGGTGLAYMEAAEHLIAAPRYLCGLRRRVLMFTKYSVVPLKAKMIALV
jgi:hypothetical protein